MTEQPDEDRGANALDWDDDVAAALIGRRVVIGLTYRRRRNESVLRYEQLHGVVRAASRERGIAVALEGRRAGETYVLPPSTGNFAPAEPGIYRLKATGESVENPDFTAVWSILEPDA